MMKKKLFYHYVFLIVSIKDTCDMLLIKKILENKTELTRYVLKAELSSFLFRQSKADKRLYYCRECLQHFRIQEKLDNHIKSCSKIGAHKTIYPDCKNKFNRFKN